MQTTGGRRALLKFELPLTESLIWRGRSSDALVHLRGTICTASLSCLRLCVCAFLVFHSGRHRNENAVHGLRRPWLVPFSPIRNAVRCASSLAMVEKGPGVSTTSDFLMLRAQHPALQWWRRTSAHFSLLEASVQSFGALAATYNSFSRSVG